MRILSIDVGIKNLALCIIEITENKEYKIIDWKVINLCGEKQVCCQVTKKGPCKSIAKFKNGGKNTCKRCLNKKGVILDNCTQIKNINAKDLSLIDIGVAIKNNLEEYNEINNDILFSKILIENQISPIANRMKTIQGMIAQFFIMKSYTSEHIEFISASNKLKLFMESKKTTYSERKILSISITSTILDSLSEWKPYFLKSKKKDDLADCFLQGLWYLKKKNLIPN